MKPPHLARWVLQRLLPPEHRGVVVSHLDSEFGMRAAAHAAAARRWYRWQALGSLPYALQLRIRDVWSGGSADLHHGVVWLKRHPKFAAGVTLTLALGVAATNTVATLATAVLLRPLPYEDPDRVVSVLEIDRTLDASPGRLSWPDFVEYQRRSSTFVALAGHNGGSRTLSLDGATPERVSVALVTPEFFPVLGVTPVFGRTLTEADRQDGAPPVTILSHSAWRARFGSDPAVLGRVITLNGFRVEVVGVLPDSFEFPPRGFAEFWLPLRPNTAQRDRKFFHWMDVIGRIRPDVSVEHAQQDLDGIAQRFAGEETFHKNAGIRVTRLHDRLVRDAKPLLLVLSLAAGLVLLVACANVAGLLLSRGVSREAEMDVRRSLGAGPVRLVRQLIAETVVLALPGVLIGVIAGQWAVGVLVAALPRSQRMALPHLASLRLDPTTAMATIAAVSVVVILFGLFPAWRSARAAPRTSGRGVVGRSRRDVRAQLMLVSGQAALALTLLAGAGLMTQSVRRVLNVSPGFEIEGLLTFTLSLSGPRYQAPETITRFFDDVTTRLGSMPGAVGVTAIDQGPLKGLGNSGGFTTAGDTSLREHTTGVRSIAPNYFDVMGIPVVTGRALSVRDAAASPKVVVVNRTLADSAFGGRPLGQRVTFPWSGPEPLEIVGVVGDEQFDAMDQPMRPVMYFPYAQSPSGAMDVMVRAAGDPRVLIGSVRERVAEVDPALPVFGIMTMEDLANASQAVFRRRMTMLLLMGFAISTVVLAAIGTYGVLAQVVAGRTREIGVRLALGASAGQVAAGVVRQSAIAGGAGLAVGVGGSLLLGRGLGALLFGVGVNDPATLAVVTGAFAAVLALACLTPVRRALRVDPMTALRNDR